jgi:hypothetical protein
MHTSPRNASLWEMRRANPIVVVRQRIPLRHVHTITKILQITLIFIIWKAKKLYTVFFC